MINKDGGGDNFGILWGDTAVMRGDIELIGGPPIPPLGKILTYYPVTQCWHISALLHTIIYINLLALNQAHLFTLFHPFNFVQKSSFVKM